MLLGIIVISLLKGYVVHVDGLTVQDVPGMNKLLGRLGSHLVPKPH